MALTLGDLRNSLVQVADIAQDAGIAVPVAVNLAIQKLHFAARDGEEQSLATFPSAIHGVLKLLTEAKELEPLLVPDIDKILTQIADKNAVSSIAEVTAVD